MKNDKIKIAYFGKHFGEEPPLKGNEKQGAGAIFFSGCNLRCVFCQNYQISQEGIGKEYTVEDLGRMMLELQQNGAVNINFVTPFMWWKQIKEAIILAKAQGMQLPVIWNSNAYESCGVLKKMEGLIDIYLPDFKYGLDDIGYKYSGVKKYSEIAVGAIREMIRQVGKLELDQEGIAKRGIIVRHLIIPNNIENSLVALKLLAGISTDLHLSLMHQFFPVYQADKYPELTRLVMPAEFNKAHDYAKDLGFANGWIQEGECQKIFVPDFTKKAPFAGE